MCVHLLKFGKIIGNKIVIADVKKIGKCQEKKFVMLIKTLKSQSGAHFFCKIMTINIIFVTSIEIIKFAINLVLNKIS